MPATSAPTAANAPTPAALRPTDWTLPSGMRATRATRALAAVYTQQPEAALSEAEVEAALSQAGVAVNRVTVYRLLDRFAAAGLLLKQVDAARVMRYVRAPQGPEGDAPRFECGDCHRQFRLSQGSAKVQSALKQVLAALATAGHEDLAVDIAVRGRCAGCAHPAGAPGTRRTSGPGTPRRATGAAQRAVNALGARGIASPRGARRTKGAVAALHHSASASENAVAGEPRGGGAGGLA